MAVKSNSTPQAKPSNSETEGSKNQDSKDLNNEQYEEIAKTALKLSKCSTRTKAIITTTLEDSSNAILALIAMLNTASEEIKKISNENKKLRESLATANKKNASLSKQTASSEIAKNRPSYADILRESPEDKHAHKSIVSTIDQNDTTSTLNKIKKVIAKDSQGISVLTHKPLANGKVLIISRTQDAKKAFEANIKKDKTLKVQSPKQQDPIILLKGVPKHINDTELVELMTNCNPEIKQALAGNQNIRKLYTRPNKKSNYRKNVAIRVPPTIRKIVIDQYCHKVNLGINLVHADDANPVIQCNKCYGYGHTAKVCANINKTSSGNPLTICWHCAGEHLSNVCPNKKQPQQCINCLKASKPANHPPTNSQCPMFRRMSALAIEKVNYGY